MPVRKADKNARNPWRVLTRWSRRHTKEIAIQDRQEKVTRRLETELRSVPARKRLGSGDPDYWYVMVKFLSKDLVSEVCRLNCKGTWINKLVDACFIRHEGGNYHKKN